MNNNEHIRLNDGKIYNYRNSESLLSNELFEKVKNEKNNFDFKSIEIKLMINYHITKEKKLF